MTTLSQLYPTSSADTVAITISLASLATSSTLLAGREGTAIDNTSNLDLDHMFGGRIRVGTSPTANTKIEVWAIMPRKRASGTTTWPQGLTGSDAAFTFSSAGLKAAVCRLVASIAVDSTTSDRDYDFAPVSIASLFGEMPMLWLPWVTQSTAQNLNSTAGNHELHYLRVKKTQA